jgi:membrane-bound serine protease (ClpP class)
MNLLLDPNVAYVLLVVGLILAILALASPGTGLLELGALLLLVLTGYSIANLPFNIWALIIIVIGVILFLFSLWGRRSWIFLVVSIITLIVGSIFLFRSESSWFGINPVLAAFVSVTAAGMMWYIGRKGLEAVEQRPSMDLSRLQGLKGEAVTTITPEGGSVHVGGENWSARSSNVIPAGSKVRVISREGLIVFVEEVKE